MAYGLRVFAGEPLGEGACVAQGGTWDDSTGCSGYTAQVQYDSTLDKGFMFLGSVSFGETGNGAGTYNVSAPRVTELFAFYIPFTVLTSGQQIGGDNADQHWGRPLISVGNKSGDNFPVTVTASGADDKRIMIGGSLEFFGR